MTPPQSAEHLTVQVSFAYDYLLHLPAGYHEQPAKEWPLVIFLHGLGERGRDLALVKRHGLPRMVEEGRSFPFILVSPQCPDTEWWNIIAVDAFIGEVMNRYRVDPRRVILTGLSMGGFGTWALAMHRPERYAAIVPVCGGGETRHAAQLRDLPVWAFHGGQDATVLPRRSQELIDAIQAAGGKPRFTLYPDLAHNVWDRAYALDELHTWMLAQRRAPAPSDPPAR